MTSSGESVGGLIRQWSHVHKVADKREERQVAKLTEVLKAHSKLEARQLVAGAQGPVLCSYSNDGTPIRTTIRKTTTGTMGRVVRMGGAGHEFVCQRAVFRTRGSTGEWKTVMQVRDPLPLVHGKGGDAIFSAAAEFLDTLRQMGHGGIAVQHYSFDRALHSCLVRRFKQHHALLASAAGGPASSTGANICATDLWPPHMLEWVVDTACVNHDVNNALKWGLLEWLQDAALMKTVFVVIESVRNGHSQIEEELGRWLVGVVQWVDEEDLMDPMEAAALWTSVARIHKPPTDSCLPTTLCLHPRHLPLHPRPLSPPPTHHIPTGMHWVSSRSGLIISWIWASSGKGASSWSTASTEPARLSGLTS